MVTAFCPLTIICLGETGLQAVGETRFVVDCKVKPEAGVGTFEGQVIIISFPARLNANCGGGNSKLNTLPVPEAPPPMVVPKAVLFDKTNPPRIPEPPGYLSNK